jgi:hypothetical protein
MRSLPSLPDHGRTRYIRFSLVFAADPHNTISDLITTDQLHRPINAIVTCYVFQIHSYRSPISFVGVLRSDKSQRSKGKRLASMLLYAGCVQRFLTVVRMVEFGQVMRRVGEDLKDFAKRIREHRYRLPGYTTPRVGAIASV